MAAISTNKFPSITIRESANDGSDFSNPVADYRVLFVGEDGLFHLKDSSGTVTTPGSSSLDAIITASSGQDIADALAGAAAPDASNVFATMADAVGGTPAFVGAQIFNSGVQAIPHNTVTAVTMDTEVFDSSGFHSGSSANMVIPSGKDGKYLCIGGTRFAGNTTGTRSIAIGVGGTRMPSQSAPLAWGVATPVDAQAMAIVNVVATNTIQLLVFQDSGGNLDVGHASAAFVQSNLSIFYLGA